MRPRLVSALTLRACRCRSRTVSERVSKRPASEPPVWDWTFTAVATYSRSGDPIRSHIAAIASSSGRPNLSSPRTWPNSSEDGEAPSSAIAPSAVRKPCPARRVEAIVARTSGSCRSKAFVRRRAAIDRPMNGDARPASISSRASAGGAPSDAADDAEDKGSGDREVGDEAGAELQPRPLQRACQPLRAGKVVQRSLGPAEQRLEAGGRSRALVGELTQAEVRLEQPGDLGRTAAAAAGGARHGEQQRGQADDDAPRIGFRATARGKRPRFRFAPGIRSEVADAAPAARTAQVGDVTLAGGGEVGELPRAVELAPEGAVGGAEAVGVGGVEAPAAGRACEGSQRRDVGARAGRDRVDDDVRLLRGGDRLLERGSRAEIVAVRQQDEHPAAARHPVQALDRQRHRVIEGGAPLRVRREGRPARALRPSAQRVAESATAPRGRTRPERRRRRDAGPSRNADAARFASRSGRPVIDAELSTASTIAWAAPSSRAVTNAGRAASSVRVGRLPAGTTAVTRTSGNRPSSTRRIWTAPESAPARPPAARARTARQLRGAFSRGTPATPRAPARRRWR